MAGGLSSSQWACPTGQPEGPHDTALGFPRGSNLREGGGWWKWEQCRGGGSVFMTHFWVLMIISASFCLLEMSNYVHVTFKRRKIRFYLTEGEPLKSLWNISKTFPMELGRWEDTSNVGRGRSRQRSILGTWTYVQESGDNPLWRAFN